MNEIKFGVIITTYQRPDVKPTVDDIVKNINTDVWEVIGLVPNKFGSKPKEKEYLNGFLLKKL
jgi:hypothetical protein